MTDKDKECRSQRGAFEDIARTKLAYLGGPFLRDCNDPYPDRDYQKWEVQEAYEFFQAGAAWQQSRLLDDELVERVESAIEGWLPNDGLAYPTEQMAKAAIAEIKKHMEGV